MRKPNFSERTVKFQYIHATHMAAVNAPRKTMQPRTMVTTSRPVSRGALWRRVLTVGVSLSVIVSRMR
ncbi:hypothetical protein LSTR_LSTR016894 [Laodelphax striatellus]|uniref:Uncharacterized protein n=1 Tax=Laodelphax striatellus TaxID=195883 RepID=A0A482XFJ6_LAOST|nr:hypothetical protein LSTR_LSTR016894 [Laodelphax striatellus]